MTRLLGPDANSRLVYLVSGLRLSPAAGDTATVYSDAAGTTLADIATYDGTGTPGSVIGGSTLTVDSTSQLPLFWFPADGTDTLYVQVAGGPVTKINADYDARLDNVTGTSYRGTWAASTAYAQNDLVSLGGELLLCATAHTSSSPFSLTNWSNLTGKPGQYNVMLYGAKGDNSTDDTAAIQAAINAAVTAEVASGRNYAEIAFPPAQYVASSATTKSATNKGNAQLYLPLIATTAQKFTLVLRGTRENAAVPHWQQTTAQKSGSVIVSTLTGQTVDGTFGPPSVIGGPTPAQGYGSSAGLFNNMLVVVDNLAVSVPANPTVMGFDFSGMAEAHLINPAVNAATTPGNGEPVTPTNSWAAGIYMPQSRNNDLCIVDNPSVQGMYFGIIAAEHTVVRGGRIVYCNTGIDCLDGQDTITLDSVSIELCTNHIQAESLGGSRVNIWARVDIEQESSGNFATSHNIQDPNNLLQGEISLHTLASAGTSDTDPIVNGGGNVRIIRMDRRPGNVTAPGVPSSTTPLTNPFWRDAVVAVTGGTVSAVSVDGTAQGFTATGFTVIVPSGKTITLTYSATPTWKWTLL